MILSTEKLKDSIEKKYHSHLIKREYKVTQIEAKELLHKDRFDLAFKLYYLHNRGINYDFARECYFEHIKAFTSGTFVEHGSPHKNSFDVFLNEFEETFTSIQSNGFDPQKSLVILSKEGVILNASHRVAIAIFLNIKIHAIQIDVSYNKYDAEFFLNKYVPKEYFYPALELFIQEKNNLKLAVIWPKGASHGLNVNKIFEQVVYSENLNLSIDGLKSIVINLYQNEKWLGNKENDFKGALNKAMSCNDSRNSTKFAIVELENDIDLIQFKDKIRQKVNLGKHSIHITDSHSETLEVSKIFFNYNSRRILERRYIEKIALNLPTIDDKQILLGPYYLNLITGSILDSDNLHFFTKHTTLKDNKTYILSDNVYNELVSNSLYHLKFWNYKIISNKGCEYLNVNHNLNIKYPLELDSDAPNKRVLKIRQSIIYLKFQIKSKIKGVFRPYYKLFKSTLFNIKRNKQ
jgi:hypothetical protein